MKFSLPSLCAKAAAIGSVVVALLAVAPLAHARGHVTWVLGVGMPGGVIVAANNGTSPYYTPEPVRNANSGYYQPPSIVYTPPVQQYRDRRSGDYREDNGRYRDRYDHDHRHHHNDYDRDHDRGRRGHNR